MIIKRLYAEEIFNAQGIPTLQCSITLANNQTIKSSIPSGFTQQRHSTFYAYDQAERFFQKGMQQAATYINTKIAPLFEQKAINVLAMDSELMDLDTSIKKTSIGGNVTLVVSQALFKAQAAAENVQLFELLQSISGTKQLKIPRPITSIFEGRTYNNQQDIKELLLIPQENSFEKNLEATIVLQHHTKKILHLKKQPTSTGAYGSFVPFFVTIQETFNILQNVFKTTPYNYKIGLNIVASDLYDQDTKTYLWNNQTLISQELIDTYKELINLYPAISYIQNGISDSDQDGWKNLTQSLKSTLIAGDTIFCTNPMLIRKGILHSIANIVVIRPEYIGTVSQTIAAIDSCKKNDRAFIIACDTGQTNDTFASDLAMGTNANFIKAGAVHTGAFIAKYNRLLSIERYLNL